MSHGSGRVGYGYYVHGTVYQVLPVRNTIWSENLISACFLNYFRWSNCNMARENSILLGDYNRILFKNVTKRVTSSVYEKHLSSVLYAINIKQQLQINTHSNWKKNLKSTNYIVIVSYSYRRPRFTRHTNWSIYRPMLWWWCMQHMVSTTENRYIRTNAMYWSGPGRGWYATRTIIPT